MYRLYVMFSSVFAMLGIVHQEGFKLDEFHVFDNEVITYMLQYYSTTTYTLNETIHY